MLVLVISVRMNLYAGPGNVVCRCKRRRSSADVSLCVRAIGRAALSRGLEG